MSLEVNHIEEQDGIYVSQQTLQNFSEFETNYITVREKEKRILSIEEIRKLPNVPKDYVHFKEWEIRKKNILRFVNYISQKKAPLRVLDIGCGNGFFTNLLAKNDHNVVGLDVNLTELKQAKRAFPGSGIKWYYLDLLNEPLPEKNFDLITFCASFQYFNDPKKIVNTCLSLLNKGGEIHIIDSPFYMPHTKEPARQRTKAYYQSMGVNDMSAYYNHNLFTILDEYNFKLMYNPSAIFNKLFSKNDSPFPWIKIVPLTNSSKHDK